MRLEINLDNFLNYLERIELSKTCEYLICIPTYNSIDTTSLTLEKLFEQQGVDFDILIIGVSGDIEKLKIKYPKINFCITKDNFGSAGNYLLSIFISKYYKYDFFTASDNEARFIENDSLKKLFEIIKNEKLVGVMPMVDNASECFHCSVYTKEVYENLEYFFNPNYFIPFDEHAFLNRLRINFPGRFRSVPIPYLHPNKLEKKCFDKKYFFLVTRSILLFFFREKLSIRIKFSKFNLRPCLTFLMYFAFKTGFEYLPIFLNALFQVLKDDYNLNYLNKLKNKIEYKELSEFDALNLKIDFKLITNQKDTFFNPKAFKYIEPDKSVKYFVRVS